MLAAELERIQAISDDEERFQAAQDVLRLLEKQVNPVASNLRNGAALALFERHGWTYDEIGDRFELTKSAVQRIMDNARGKSRKKRPKPGSTQGA
jgi:DNA-directed RNA polymerase specialized sigma24 family protein